MSILTKLVLLIIAIIISFPVSYRLSRLKQAQKVRGRGRVGRQQLLFALQLRLIVIAFMAPEVSLRLMTLR